MSITQWPADEQPREKLLSKGAAALSDAELLAIFLRTGCKGKSAVDLARDLLKRFNGLRSLMQSDRSQFCSAKGLGPAKFVQLQAVLEMSKRHLEADLQSRDQFTSSAAVKDYLLSQLRDKSHEVFAILYLDNQHQLIRFDELFRGTIDGSAVYPREVVKSALAHNAAAVIFAHNHPSGVAEPSQADISITKHLSQALGLVDIRSLDHLIVANNTVISLAERGLMPQ